MVTLIAMFLQGIYVGTDCILIYARGIRLWEASYEGKDGQIHSMTLSVAFQVMTLPSGKFSLFFLLSCDFFQSQLFQKILSGIP